MLHADNDDKFGALRPPESVQEWEKKHIPISRVLLNKEVGSDLASQKNLAMSPLLRAAAKSVNYIWAMDADCNVWIACEELAPINDEVVIGTPRRRGEHVEKLGHPTLLGGEQARIAGEFYLDETESDGLVWTINVLSGRYCRKAVPNDQHKTEILKLFQSLIEDDIILDEGL